MNDRHLDIVELEGGYRPAPLPPGWQSPQQASQLVAVRESDSPEYHQGKYGRQVNYAYPGSVDASPILVFAIDRQPGPPRTRTLNLFRQDATLGVGLFNADVYAKVTYGVGGVQNQALIDWSRGGQISLTCDSLSVEAVAYAPSDALPYTPPLGSQLLGAMLTHEGSAPPRPPTFTTQSVLLAPDQVANFVVPDFARWCFPRISTYVPPDSGDFLVFGNLFAIALARFQLTTTLLELGTPIPGGTTQVSVRHSNAVLTNQRYLLQFELGL